MEVEGQEAPNSALADGKCRNIRLQKRRLI